MAKDFGTLIGVFLFGVVVGGFTLAIISDRQLAERDRELAEYRTRSVELEQQYSVVRARADELAGLIEARAELDRRAIEEATGIGDRIRNISLQGKSIAEKLRILTSVISEIQRSVQVLEEFYNSGGGGSSN